MDDYAVFEELYKKYNPTVYHYCYGNEDYMQDVWMEIWKHIRRGTLRSTDAAYMNTAIRQDAHISYYSKKHRPFEAYIETFFKEEWQTVPDVAHCFETKEWIRGLFKSLAPQEAETLKLILMGYDGAEISRFQKNTRQSVSNTKRRAQRKAKEYASSN
mgnify:CR=1 FL=1